MILSATNGAALLLLTCRTSTELRSSEFLGAETNAIAVERRDAERSERLPRKPRIEVLDLRASASASQFVTSRDTAGFTFGEKISDLPATPVWQRIES